MHLKKKNIILSALVILLFTACSVIYDEPGILYSDTPVNISLTRADEESPDPKVNYGINLMFWQGENTTIPASLFASLSLDDFGGPHLLKNGDTQLYYPGNNSSIWGVGFLPKDSLTVTDNYNTLTLNTKRPAGFLDVCSTDLIEGNENSPFNNDNKKFQFKHTLVKLNFIVERTENVNARIWNVRLKVKGSGIRDIWNYSQNGYEPGVSTGKTYSDLEFTTGNEYMESDNNTNDNGNIETQAATRAIQKELFYEFTRTDEAGKQLRDSLNICYIAHNATDIFSFNEQENQAYITLYDFNAKITKGENTGAGGAGTVDMKPVPELTIPLTEDDGTTPWNKAVQPGDAFTIHIVFDQNKLRLWGQKQPWEPGGRLYIPLDPRQDINATN